MKEFILNLLVGSIVAGIVAVVIISFCFVHNESNIPILNEIARYIVLFLVSVATIASIYKMGQDIRSGNKD